MEDNILLLLRRLHLIVEQYLGSQMKMQDISPSQGFVLYSLYARRGRAAYASELHKELGLSKSALSVTLGALKEKGYLEITSSPADERKKQITLTEKAAALEDRMRTFLFQQQEALCRNIPPPRRDALKKELQTMIANIHENTQGGIQHGKNTIEAGGGL